MTELDELVKRRDELLALQEQLKAKLKARPRDYGIVVLWAFIIVGLLVGCIEGPRFWLIIFHSFAFLLAGMLFCIFVLDSAEVQSRLALLLHHKLREKHFSHWLYQRALTFDERHH